MAPTMSLKSGAGARRGASSHGVRTSASSKGSSPLLNTVVAAPSDVLIPAYCDDTTRTLRRKTRTVTIGNVKVGSEHPVVKQTMLTTDTRDVQATIDEAKRCADAGAEMVRITVQGLREAEAAMEIRNGLFKDGYDTPLIADIHFNPKAALKVADAFEKIRINPGNYADGRKKFEEITYEDPADYQRELDDIEETFTPLVLKCKEMGRAIRIGTNHGSLSARTLSYFGDTPKGMVESAFEFARICRKHDYHNFVFSMKASNPLVMVQAYRLLASEMYKEGWDYPLHLGVTEAGEGEDGRMKSSIGIGALLLDGLGDTVRVSLTEAPELELAPCAVLTALGEKAVAGYETAVPFEEKMRDFRSYDRREVELPEQREGDSLDYRGICHRDGSVFGSLTVDAAASMSESELYTNLGCKTVVGMPFKDIATVDSIYFTDGGVPPSSNAELRRTFRRLMESNVHVICDEAALTADPMDGAVAVYNLSALDGSAPSLPEGCERFAVRFNGMEDAAAFETLAAMCKSPESRPAVLLAQADTSKGSRMHTMRRAFELVKASGLDVPVVHVALYEDGEVTLDEFVIRTGGEVGGCLVDGLGEGVCVKTDAVPMDDARRISFGLLQGCRMRNTKTEFISCPSCGRTLFDLQEVTAQIASRTGHLPGVSVAIMGCIVNGPGEMADADFGYVGGAPGKVDLYVGKEVVKRAIPNEEACDALIDLIKEYGRWKEPDSEEEEAEAVAA